MRVENMVLVSVERAEVSDTEIDRITSQDAPLGLALRHAPETPTV